MAGEVLAWKCFSFPFFLSFVFLQTSVKKKLSWHLYILRWPKINKVDDKDIGLVSVVLCILEIKKTKKETENNSYLNILRQDH